MFYSPSDGGFYDPAIHKEIPTDAVRISRARYAQLIDARATGKLVEPDASGRPQIREVRHSLAELRDRATAAVKREAGRRILSIASMAQQSNDNAAIALSVLTGADASEPIARRTRIDAIRAASNAIEAVIARMPAANLKSYDAPAHPLWPQD